MNHLVMANCFKTEYEAHQETKRELAEYKEALEKSRKRHSCWSPKDLHCDCPGCGGFND